MKKTLYYLFIFIALMLPGVVSAASGNVIKANEHLLLRLDSLIANHAAMVSQKENRIAELKKTLASVESVQDKHGVVRQIFDEYQVYDSDSALQYAKMGMELSRRIPDYDYNLLAEWELRMIFIYVVQGMSDEARLMLEKIRPEQLSDKMKCRYYKMMEYIYSMRSLYYQADPEKCKSDIDLSNSYRDSINAIDASATAEFSWVGVALMVERETFGEPGAEAEVEKLRRIVDATDEPSRNNATNAYWLSRYYDCIGNDDLSVRYLTKAAISDTRILNREIAAIQELAFWLFDHGDVNRAYNYLLYAENQTNAFHNRFRIISLTNTLPIVRDAYRAEIEKRDARLHTLVWILALIGALLLLLTFYIIVENRRLNRTRKRLAEVNRELADLVADRDRAIVALEKANTDLSSANAQKLSVLGYAFKLTSDYISSLDEYRKKLLRKYKVNQISELGALLNDPDQVKELYQDFYEGFDKMVLSIFPDFLQEYYQAVPDDIPAAGADAETPDKARSLSTRQRIHALRRLGVDKSADIAKMLNVSIRTVYNNRTPGQ